MAKFKNGLVQEYKHTQHEKAEQERLRHEHNIKDSNVVVVEKDSSIISLIRIFGRVVQIAAAILLVILAAIGILSLIYPEPREAMLTLFHDMWNHIQSLV
jgi:hypothetical protein